MTAEAVIDTYVVPLHKRLIHKAIHGGKGHYFAIPVAWPLEVVGFERSWPLWVLIYG